jgi:hypothetical protein|tara:strand:- start:40 stop:171 length:132 start_codon:yes stop_codon:yes gene_type:complete
LAARKGHILQHFLLAKESVPATGQGLSILVNMCSLIEKWNTSL